jgi:hypothetical protein
MNINITNFDYFKYIRDKQVKIKKKTKKKNNIDNILAKVG